MMPYESQKRMLDILVGTVVFIFFLPVFVLAPIWITLDSRGPVFADIPMRVGRKKKLFRLFKFRTMIPNAHRLMKTDPKFKKLYDQYRKNSYKISLKEDPRITRFGRWLRRFSLDELPQVLNVLRGEMSIVGPRAYYPDELENQQKVYPQSKTDVEELLKVKPGITGYWQVKGRSEINFDKRVKMDAAYARKKSIIWDIMIILQTPWAMLSGKGAI